VANRVTDDEVHGIMIDLDDTVDTTPFIETANLVITEKLVGKGLTDAMLIKIELWLSAHFATLDVEKGGLRSSKLGEADESYVWTRGGSGFGTTRYGLTAIALDTSGILQTLSAQGAARLTVV